MVIDDWNVFFFSSRRRHTRCALVTGVQTCALPIYGWKICEIAKNGTDVWTGGVLCRLQIGAEQAGEPSSVEERIDALIGLERRTGQAQVDPWTEQHDGGRSGSVDLRDRKSVV